MRIARLDLNNWGSYRGTHVLELQARPYGIVAQYQDDPGRSNGAGKSLILEAVRFALYGQHRHRTEDEWISRGEPSGQVTLTTDTGLEITRSRKRGRSTQVQANDAKGQEAQLLVEQQVGLSPADFLVTSYFEQKRMSRLLVADPGDRMAIVAGWLRLERLQACEHRCTVELGRLSDGANVYRERMRVNQEVAAQVLARAIPVAALEEGGAIDGMDRRGVATTLAGHEADLEAEAGQLDGLVARLERERDEHQAWQQDAEQASQYDELVERGRQLAQELVASPVDAAQVELLREQWGRAMTEHEQAAQESRERASLARGEFDGRCPVGACPCPIAPELRRTTKATADLARNAADRFAVATTERARATFEHNQAEQQLRDQDRQAERLQQMRERVKELQPAARRIKQRGRSPAEHDSGPLEHARRQALQLRGQAERVRDARVEWERRCHDDDRTVKHLAALQLQEQTAREALLIFGRQGAQRRIAEDALGEIEQQANDLLTRCAIDLRVEVRWAREGKGLADSCDQCGAPFPTSQRVKVCARCAAPRGPKLINRLELEPSWRSGAAEDLVGIAFQLAASAWLRQDRGCAWSTALIDEPFSALDTSMRSGLATHLASALGDYGYDQAFLCAHNADALNALPGRIQIVHEGGWSRVEVT